MSVCRQRRDNRGRRKLKEMEETFIVKPIGVIVTPYNELNAVAPQARFDPEMRGQVVVFPPYEQGLKDLDGFSHIFLVYRFHKAVEEKLIARPFFEKEAHGIFAIRGPCRPNRIGLSIVTLEEINGNIIHFRGVDMLDQTPLLDIKPYVSVFDSRQDVKNGWLEKHFKDGTIPRRVK